MTDEERAILEAAFDVYQMGRAKHFGPGLGPYLKALADLMNAVEALAAENDGELRISG
jgi:hypothetical protein